MVMNKEITQLPFFKKPTSQEEYDEGLKNYGKFGRLWQLGLADWMLTGQEEGYMKRGVYDRASELTGIDKRALQNYVSIYKSINKSSLHSEDLTYSHYEKVSSLDLEQQQHFLQQAAENGWSVARLKQTIKNHEIEKERQQRQQQRKSLSESDKHFDDKETTVMSDSDKTGFSSPFFKVDNCLSLPLSSRIFFFILANSHFQPSVKFLRPFWLLIIQTLTSSLVSNSFLDTLKCHFTPERKISTLTGGVVCSKISIY